MQARWILSSIVILLLICSLGYLVSSSRELSAVANPVLGLWGAALPSKHPRGSIVLEGLRSKVVVVWDKWGVPYIFADNEEDLYYAFGFVQGMDRMFQMDLTRRVASGRLSELLGEATLETDRFFRILGLHRAARETWEAMLRDPAMERYVRALEAYTRGVNSYIEWAVSNNMLPVEYRLLGVAPEKWSPVDSLAVGKLISWGLAGGFDDLELKAFLDANGYDALVELRLLERPLNTPILGGVEDAEYPRGSWLASYTPASSGGSRVSRELLEWLRRVEQVVRSLVGEMASNNWVISGKLTNTGAPILANDPHLSLQAPPTWYEACLVLRGGEHVVRGVTFPGIPVIVIGRNNHVAWGFTNVGADVTDFYYYVWREGKYLYRGEWLTPTTIVEEIKVRRGQGFDVVKLLVNVTVHGPLIERFGERYAIAWTGLKPTYELVALYLMNYARNVYEFMEAQRFFMVPAQNAVYADVDGNIAYYPAGTYPIRGNVPVVEAAGRRVPNLGFLPFNGSRDEGRWVGSIPFEEIPHVFNPERGYIVTANNAPVPNDYKYYLGWKWADRFRHDRIVEMIERVLRSGGKITVEYVMRMQTDYRSLAAETLVPLLLKAIEGRLGELSEIESKAVSLLRGWNYVMDPDRPEPAIYTLWLQKFYERLWSDEYESAGIGGRFLPLEVAEYILRGELEGWGDFSKWTDEPIDQLVLAALRDAVSELRSMMGDEVSEWRWGDIHVYTLDHPLGSVLAWMNYPRHRAPGGYFTVNVAGGLKVKSGPSIRYIAVLSPGATGYIVLPGGNVGHPLSIHYYDQLSLWVRGGYKELSMPTSPQEVYEPCASIELVPGG